jgi:ribosomal protein L29
MAKNPFAGKSGAELSAMIAELRQNLYGLERKTQFKQLSAVRQIRQTRKELAQALTSLRQADTSTM